MSLATNTTIKSSINPNLLQNLPSKVPNLVAATSTPKPVDATVVRTATNPLLDWAQPSVDTTGSAVNTGKLTNLKEKLDGIDTAAVTSAKDRFLTGAFGSANVGNAVAGSQLDGLQGSASSASRNPLANSQLDQFRGDGRSFLMDDPPADSSGNAASSDKSSFDWGAFFTSVGTSIVGHFEHPAVPLSGFVVETDPETLGDKVRGFLGLVRQGRTGTSNENANDQLKGLNYDGDPLPDDVANPSGPPQITQETLKQLGAMRGNKGQPTPDDAGSTSTGPINTGATGTGRTASLSQPVNDDTAASRIRSLTAADKIAIETRITSKITVTH